METQGQSGCRKGLLESRTTAWLCEPEIHSRDFSSEYVMNININK